jgi:hypothetical protein
MGKHHKHKPHKGHSGHKRGVMGGMWSKLKQSLSTQDRQEDTRRVLSGSCHDEWAAAATGGGRTFRSAPRLVQVTGESFAMFAIFIGIFGIEQKMKKAKLLPRVQLFSNAIGLTPLKMLSYLEAVLMCDFASGNPGLTWTELLNLYGNELEWTEHMESKIPKAPAKLKQKLTEQWENGYIQVSQSQEMWKNASFSRLLLSKIKTNILKGTCIAQESANDTVMRRNVSGEDLEFFAELTSAFTTEG